MKGIGKILATGCVIFTIAGCNHQSGPLSQEEKHIVTELTENLKTRCVGRYLIDLPEDATESGYATIGGVYIETKAMTEDAYRQEVSQREAQLKATKSIDAYPFLYSAENAPAREARYFIHRGTVYSDPATDRSKHTSGSAGIGSRLRSKPLTIPTRIRPMTCWCRR
ncbi:hypothetical protein [Paraburkholderia silvatlantica]|uniref:hypothetical protein n=1 Tax=Paraburkholderia silvatlantica TaxID=321895 RepID=UPI001061A0F4|nr:hypothetical protein [Paraburkholderia silvatlantica]